MISFDPKVFVIEIVMIKCFILEAILVIKDNIYAEIPLVDWDVVVLLKVAMIKFDISCFQAIIFII